MVVYPRHQLISGLRNGSRHGVAVYADRQALVAQVLEREHAVRCPATLDLAVGDLQICPGERTAAWRGVPLRLTPREFDILTLLADHAGKVVSRSHIFDHVWDTDFAGEARLVDEHIMKLRRKLGDGAVMIETVRGTGYRLTFLGDHG